ncbi:PrsW family glutamic-type intramembrane protease [Streptomyces canus]|uniref:PrsW family glutamic-type intramembrane protease n=1 Tax=Streptomyces canus TaxID=58343 RepID=UPI0027D7F428|nr:PrsW family glutamic-type intramembrane protease [Streptomyces canus]
MPWAYERHGRDLGVSVILGCFLTGGTRGMRAGLVLGVTVGFGSAALESAGYACNAAVSTNGRFPFAGPVIGTLVGVSPPHALWDSTHGIVLWLMARPASTRPDRELFAWCSCPFRRRVGPGADAAGPFLEKYPLGV